jgi:hypothetical protein
MMAERTVPVRAVGSIAAGVVARGWRPTPARLRDGARVLGFAACAVTGEHHA